MAEDTSKTREKGYAVVVMGMHRSGTSALAGVLARLGCDAPKDLMPAQPQNPKGFYESLSINSFNDTLLSSAGFTWYTWQQFNKAWFRSPKADQMMDLMGGLLTEAFGGSHLILLKDPRISLLMPFWHEALSHNGYDPRYLHINRHPADVAKSIETWAAVSKERLPGYSAPYGELVWLRYVLEGEVATRNHKRHFTSYARLMQDWGDVARRASDGLGLAWPSLSYHVEGAVAKFLDKDLDHGARPDAAQPGGPGMTPWVAATFEIFDRWANTGEDPKDHATLDAILADFNRAAPVFSPLIEANRKDAFHLQARLEREQAQRQTDAAEAGRTLASAREELAAANLSLRELRLAKLRDEQVTRDQLSAALRGVREQADEAVAAAEARVKAMSQQQDAAQAQRRVAEDHVQVLLNSASWRLTGPLRAIVTALRGLRG